ncbi:MAG TPA: LysR family transcriptional regulator [Bradyrhizobium sp.]|jgi:LysR family glycine cleavage system transcriptional activator|nr:LysR family transcriptional regulator [Bradyrhizobium sp.]
MSYKLPPLNALRAFEASARHLSFKRAADELCVTAGAVSQQVKSLETSMGLKLFRRLPRGLLLTAAGESYLPSISRAFHAISEATEGVASVLKGRQLRLGISPRLKKYPAIDGLRGQGEQLARLTLTDDLNRLLEGKLDALLRTSPQSPPGLHVDRIELQTSSGTPLPATLVTLPGLAGCREHRALLKRLRGA